MALTGKLEVGVETQSTAIEVFHFFTKNLHNLHNTTDSIHVGELHQGDDWHAIGSVKNWSFTVDGKVVTCKERFEEIDEERKYFKVEFFDGDIKKEYKSFKFTVTFTDKKEGGGAIVKFIFFYEKIHEGIPDPKGYFIFFYEKIHEGIPDPKGYLDYGTTVIKDVDAYLLSQKAK